MSTTAKTASLTWLGHSAFHLETARGKNILLDPWLDNPKAPRGAASSVRADYITLSHGHSDHVGNTIEIAKRTGATVVAIYEITTYLQGQGVKKVQAMNKGGTVTLDGISFTMVDAKHSSALEAGTTMIPGGEAAGFVIRLEDGLTLYHAGDTAVFSDMKLIADLYHPTVVMLPIGNVFTMGPREAALACTLLQPERIIGMHYGTFPLLSGTPALLREQLPASLRHAVMELEPGRAVPL